MTTAPDMWEHIESKELKIEPIYTKNWYDKPTWRISQKEANGFMVVRAEHSDLITSMRLAIEATAPREARADRANVVNRLLNDSGGQQRPRTEPLSQTRYGWKNDLIGGIQALFLIGSGGIAVCCLLFLVLVIIALAAYGAWSLFT